MNLIIENPLIIQQIVPFFMLKKDQKVISWDHNDMLIWASFQGYELNIRCLKLYLI